MSVFQRISCRINALKYLNIPKKFLIYYLKGLGYKMFKNKCFLKYDFLPFQNNFTVQRFLSLTVGEYKMIFYLQVSKYFLNQMKIKGHIQIDYYNTRIEKGFNNSQLFYKSAKKIFFIEIIGLA